MLRARKPEAVQKRLKLFMYGTAGVGKTSAAIKFPKAYVIDCERGTENYEKVLTASGSVVFQSSDMTEIIAEVKSLLTEAHDYRTLVIDPITTAYNDLLEKSEQKVGSDFGRHYGAANKEMKRLANLILALDMNVVVTAHAKAEYGQNLAKLGITFDGWRQLDYWFDLVVELQKKGKKRLGKVVKTRIETFEDESTFEWSYDAIKARYDVGMLEKESATVAMASPEQVGEIKSLLSVVRLPEGTTDKWFAKANVDAWEDMPAEALARCIEYVRDRLPTIRTPARTQANGNSRPRSAPPVVVHDRPDVSTWPRFKECWDEAAQLNGWTPSQADRALHLRLQSIDHVGRQDHTTEVWRIGTIAAMRAKLIDPATGRNENEPIDDGDRRNEANVAGRELARKLGQPMPEDTATWEAFMACWNAGAQANGWEPALAEKVLRRRLMLIGRVGKEADTTEVWRKGTLMQLYADAIDPETGKNKAPEAVASALS